MRPLTAKDEATLRAIAERHGFLAARGPHTGEGSASRLIDALLAGDVVTLTLAPADRRRLVAWLDALPPPRDASPPSCGAWPRSYGRLCLPIMLAAAGPEPKHGPHAARDREPRS